MSSHSRKDFTDLVGRQIGVSDWIEINQDTVNAFAACTGDNQFIHIDAERARQTPFGGTIAHGLLTLSILAPLQRPFTSIEGASMTINYGFNRVRFVKPVLVGSRIRGRYVLRNAENISPSEFQIILETTAEIEGMEKPAAVAELVLRKYF